MNDDQEKLTEEEKNETQYKALGSNNPRAPQNIVEFSFKERKFKQDQPVDHMVYHVSMEGNILTEDSLEYEDQK